MTWKARPDSRMKKAARPIGVAGLTVIVTILTVGGPTEAQDRWGFGTDVGLWTGTAANTRFAIGFNADYYLDRAFSVGPMMLLAPTGDLTEVAFAGVARYHFRAGAINIVPFAGLGLVHASLSRGNGPSSVDTNDTSYFIPLGLTLEYQLARKLALATTLMVNLHDLSFDQPVGNDRTSVALMFGVRYGP